ncbi:MAG: ATP-binding protein, partial [Thermoleophilia bacterium]|nr:ATP-binding protein [Thermoleophilia bacterium]
EPYLGLRYPASDIPAQARALYLRNRLRIIPDAHYVPVPLLPGPGAGSEPLDLSDAVLRSVSPVHLEYLANMGVRASMSVSVVREGRLWGLVACHHRTPRRLPAAERAAALLLAGVLAARVGDVEAREDRRAEEPARDAFLDLLARVDRAPSVADALLADPAGLLRVAGAGGALVAVEGRREGVGEVPAPADLDVLLGWLAEVEEPVVVTERLTEIAPVPGARETASGLLAVSLRPADPGWVCWFRPEVVRQVDWAGDPHKAAEPGDEGGRLSPRRSFALWRETVRGRARPWRAAEVDLAWEVRWALSAAATRHAQARAEAALRARNAELAALTAALERSNRDLATFAAAVSHDLRAPLRAITSFAEVLRRRLHGAGDPSVEEALASIDASAGRMRQMIDGLLEWSAIGREEPAARVADPGAVLDEVLGDLAPLLEEAGARVERGALPDRVAMGPVELRRLLQNLVENAVRYRSDAPVRIRVGAEAVPGAWDLWVADTGIGIPEGSRERVFEIFRRAAPGRDGGIGLGLAVCRRIVERNGGRIRAEAAPGGGALIRFSVPRA